MTMYKVCHTR